MANVSAVIKKEPYKTEIVAGQNKLVSDEPVSNGGMGMGFSPGELLCASLASCTSITLRMYADKKEWPLDRVEVDVEFERNEEKNTSSITRKIHLLGTLDAEKKERLMAMADKCPMHKTLSNQINITTLAV
ncbi:MAG TPA: OsmC family protein [Bacteroidia bacterium]|nr:OsmC family protein [Bacteroidia bacterium]